MPKISAMLSYRMRKTLNRLHNRRNGDNQRQTSYVPLSRLRKSRKTKEIVVYSTVSFFFGLYFPFDKEKIKISHLNTQD